jgi:hypothetical protein
VSALVGIVCFVAAGFTLAVALVVWDIAGRR